MSTLPMIGIVSIGHDGSFFAERYFRDILTMASQTAVLNNALITILPLTEEEGRSSAQAIARIEQQQLDALIVVAPSEQNLPTLAALFAIWPGVILSPPGLEIALNYVASDHYGIMHEIVAHLVAVNRRRILLLQPTGILTGDYAERQRGFLAAMAAHQLTPMVASIEYPMSAETTQRLILMQPVDAVITPNDHYALALTSQLRRIQMHVPDDIALVGFDDEEFARDMFPPLTTVAQPLSLMAQHATEYLIGRLQHQHHDLIQAILPNTLVVRESTTAE